MSRNEQEVFEIIIAATVVGALVLAVVLTLAAR
jgi:hypothetical protein